MESVTIHTDQGDIAVPLKAIKRQVERYERNAVAAPCNTCGQHIPVGEGLQGPPIPTGRVIQHARTTVDVATDDHGVTTQAICCFTVDLEPAAVTGRRIIQGAPDDNGFINPGGIIP